MKYSITDDQGHEYTTAATLASARKKCAAVASMGESSPAREISPRLTQSIAAYAPQGMHIGGHYEIRQNY